MTEPQETYDEGEQAGDLNRAIGKQVKVLRERAGLTQKELGDQLGYSEDLISSLERGRRTPQREFLEAADELLGAGGLLTATVEDVEKAKARGRVRHPAWFRDYARLEASAVEINFFSMVTVPGLLQTENYARVTFTVRQPLWAEETIEQRVSARMARQEILTGWPPPIVTAVIDEAVLRREIGGRKVQQDQLRHLLKVGRLRSTTLQVLPLRCDENPAVDGPFVLLTPKGKPQVAYLEVQGTSHLITDPEEVRILAARYGAIRGQALTPRESLGLMDELLGDR
ncbi:helix-turn-helix domain-containing protein [Streptomyces sporangiiformans]|uniref:Helix-turn-helix domain-containing protein n=1 Tax=Streptomyces sporangiiformans TaxID=2315329 RepID=A0A505D0H9_9ACTN|nr:helix-turn-helix transcriptional regulator [Streptomyces sporangiiformans]TPQ15652.1 helix-turn-helix domain-containing protein [Streptomyces sporangiiformans]